MFDSSVPSVSNSRSFRLTPPLKLPCGDFVGALVVDVDNMLSAGETNPDCMRDGFDEAMEFILAAPGRAIGGRMGCFLDCEPATGLERYAMLWYWGWGF